MIPLLSYGPFPNGLPFSSATVPVAPGQWVPIVRHLISIGMISVLPYSSFLFHGGRPLLNGAFGVSKRGKFLQSGEDVLRLVVNCIPSNAIQFPFSGDISTLPFPHQWKGFEFLSSTSVMVSEEDTVASFSFSVCHPCGSPILLFPCPWQLPTFPIYFLILLPVPRICTHVYMLSPWGGCLHAGWSSISTEFSVPSQPRRLAPFHRWPNCAVTGRCRHVWLRTFGSFILTTSTSSSCNHSILG